MPEAQPKKPVGLRTFADDYQRLSGKTNTSLENSAPRAIKNTQKEETLSTIINDVPETQPSKKTSITIDDTTATQADVRDVVASYDTSEDSIQEHFDDLDVTLNNEESADTNNARVAEDVAAHTVDVDALLTDENSAAVGIKSQDVNFQDDNGESGNANIIRETKGERFHLFPAIIESIKGWFVAKKETKIAKEAAKPTVVNPETRKERLKEAARHSALPKGAQVLVAKDKESVSKDKQAAESDGLSIKEKSAVPTPSWSHVIAEDAEVEEVIKTETAPEEPAPESVPKASTPTPPATKTEDAQTVTPEVTQKPVAVEVADVSTETSVTQTAPTAVEETSLEERSSLPVSQTVASDASARPQQTSSPVPRFYLTLFGAILLAIILGGVVAFGVYSITKELNKTEVMTIESATIYDEQIGLSAVNPYNFLQEAAQTVTTTENTTLHIYPTTTSNEGEVTVLTPEALLQPLNTNITDPFLRAIDTLTFGSTRAGAPFVVITVNDFDIAFAGMLSWEQSIADDLSPFLGEATTEPFVDVRFANQDLRLSDRLDDELVYTFVNKRTIIITTDRGALQEINTLLQ